MSDHDREDTPELVHTEHDESQDELVELALGALAEPRRSELVARLASCHACRVSYDEIVASIDVVLPAAPATSPQPGFDVRVLHALGIDGPRAAAPTRLPPVRRRTGLLLAAAALFLVAMAGGAAIGGLAVEWGSDQPNQAADPPDQAAVGTSTLWKDDGERVGTATVGWLDDRRVLVLNVNKPVVGVGYRCRVHVAGGKEKTLTRWEADSEAGGTWVVPMPKGRLAAVELVTDSGETWASATLNG